MDEFDELESNLILNDDLLLKLLDDDIDNEEVLSLLAEHESIPQFVLKKSFINDDRFDYLCGLTNVLRRLMRIHDDVVNQWLGLDFETNNEFKCVVSFIFEILNSYYERLCFAQMIEFTDL